MWAIVGDQVWGPQDDQLKKGFQLKPIYVQLFFLLNIIFWYVLFDKKKAFNWNPLTFNSFEPTVNWFSFETSRKSLDKKNSFQLKSIDFQFIWIYFQSSFLLNLKEISWYEKRFSIEIHWRSINLNLLSINFLFKPKGNLLNSLDTKKGFQLKSIDVQFIWIYFH